MSTKKIGFISLLVLQFLIATGSIITIFLLDEFVWSVTIMLLVFFIFSLISFVFVLIYYQLKFNRSKEDYSFKYEDNFNASLGDINLFEELFSDIHSGIMLLNNQKEVIEISNYLKERNFDYFINKSINNFIDLNKTKRGTTLNFNESYWKLKYFEDLNIVFISDETNSTIYRKKLKREIVIVQIKFDVSHLEDIDNYELTTVLNKVASRFNAFFKNKNGIFVELLSKNFGIGITSTSNAKNYKNYLVQFVKILVEDLEINYPNNKVKFYVGISHGIENFDAISSLASEALKYAQIRGDYQIVSKAQDSELEYLTESEKKYIVEDFDKMSLQPFISNLQKKLIYADRVLVMTHKNADLDAIGSSVGIKQYLDSIKIRNDLFVKTFDDTTWFYLNMNYPNIQSTFTRKINENEITSKSLLIITDTSKISLLEDPKILSYFSKENIFIIDHHKIVENELIETEELNKLINLNASSASEMVMNFIEFSSIKKGELLEENTLDLIMAGIYLDTNGLKVNVTQKTFEYVGQIIAKIGSLKKITDSFAKTNSLDLDIYNEIIKNNKRVQNKKAIISYIDESRIVKSDEVAIFTNELLEFKNVNLAIVVAKISPSKFKASIRSKEDQNGHSYFDSSKIAAQFGGGGKEQAAAIEFDATLSTSSLEKIVDDIYKYILSI